MKEIPDMAKEANLFLLVLQRLCMVNGQRLSYVQFRWIAEAWTGGETHATHVTEYHTNKHERVCGIQRALMLVQINR